MIVSKIGESMQEFRNNCPDGYVIMNSERPSISSIASSSGEWVDDENLEIKAQMTELEKSITTRMLLGYTAGDDEYAIEHVNAIRAEIEALRATLTTS